MAAHSKLTPEMHGKIVTLIKGGVYKETAAATQGIGRATLFSWLRKGAKEGAPDHLRRFAEAVHEAEALDESRSVLELEKIANTATSFRSAPCPRCKTVVKIAVPTKVQLAALMWKLERKFPTRYGNTLRIEDKTRERLQEMLEAILPRLSEGAKREVLLALADEQLGEAAPDLPATLPPVGDGTTNPGGETQH